MKVSLLITGEKSQFVLTPETSLEKTLISCIKEGEVKEAFVSQISFSDNANGILRDVAQEKSLIISIK